MKIYSAEKLSATERYKLLSGSVIPRPIAWITTQNEAGLVNAAPFSFFNVVSSNPALLAVSFTGEKDSFKNLLATKEAVVQLVSSENVREMNQTASPLPSDVSEPAQFGLELVPSQSVLPPGLANSKVRFETELYRHIPLENEVQLMLFRVKTFLFDEKVLDPENFHVLPEALDPIARLAGNQYARLGDLFEIERPR